ncbi:MAG: sigma-54-dependent Fis family transcriptional regulator [Acidobacteria bacterium]|nr:sigma-54-dependent Fis family transcriptional regulator [Acidobacteriota bacterium]
MRSVLLSWIGHTDLRAPEETDVAGVGPVAQALRARAFDHAFLVTDHDGEPVSRYREWLDARADGTVLSLLHESLTGPTDFGEIYEAAVRACEQALGGDPENTSLTFHLSPGTPAMAAVWIILAKTRFPGALIESSRAHGVQTASVPFDISADFLPDLLRRPDRDLQRLSAGLAPDAPEFDEIIHRGRAMARVILLARRVAPRSVSVLIEGETGTGKELLAKAIHRASPRRQRPLVVVNCGALPPDLVEAELFGHEKGAFTGAITRRRGHFQEADGGTLFLDEVGELPKPAQVKLLRALQSGEILPIGSSRGRRVDVRVIAATNRSLSTEVTTGRFREDLFHRLAVAVLRLPALRERPEDIQLLVDRVLVEVNREGEEQPGYVKKKISSGARNLIAGHSWPGNVRELQNTLCRAAIWSSDATLTTEDLREALLPVAGQPASQVLDRPLGNGLDLPAILASVARHYLQRAMHQTRGNKTEAARLVGLPSYQTLTNWLTKYGVEH